MSTFSETVRPGATVTPFMSGRGGSYTPRSKEDTIFTSTVTRWCATERVIALSLIIPAGRSIPLNA